MLTYKRIGIVGSREFKNYAQILREFLANSTIGDWIISGGAIGVDSMAQRIAKQTGHPILIFYPDYDTYGKGATFTRNKEIVQHSDIVLAFYVKDRFQMGGTSNSAEWARKLGVELLEFREE